MGCNDWQEVDGWKRHVAHSFGLPTWRMREYKRMRELGWAAQKAWRVVKLREKFFLAVEAGSARIVTLAEDQFWENAFDRDAVSDAQWKALSRRVENDGYWTYGVEVRDADGDWEFVDSCGGFIGDDWFDSGYDTDMMSAALDRLDDVAATKLRRAELVDEIGNLHDTVRFEEPATTGDRLRLIAAILELDIDAYERVRMALAVAKDRPYAPKEDGRGKVQA